MRNLIAVLIVIAALGTMVRAYAAPPAVVVCINLPKAQQLACKADADAWLLAETAAAADELKFLNEHCRPDMVAACTRANRELIDARLAEARDMRQRAQATPVPMPALKRLKPPTT